MIKNHKGNMKRKIFIKVITLIMILFGATLLVSCNNNNNNNEKITVLFDVNAGNSSVENSPGPITIDKGGTVAEPSPAPVRRNYDFTGWYTSSDASENPFDFSTKIEQNNFVLYAGWREKVTKHKVIFDYNYETNNLEVEVSENHKLSEPTSPIRDGYRFEGWYIDEGLNTKYNFNNEVTNSFTLYANWVLQVAVTFDLNYEGSTSIVVNIDKGLIPTRPNTPVRSDDFVFGGWFIDKEGNNSYTFAAVNENITIYAKWLSSTSTSYSVDFDLNYDGAPKVESQTVVENGVIQPFDPSREGYRFLGWFTDPNVFEDKFEETTPIISDVVLYAKWVETRELTLNYNFDGSNEPTVIIVDKGLAINMTGNPSRIGHTFAGWSGESKGQVGFDFESGILDDTTIYAQWSKESVFEAEHLDFSEFNGWGFSGNAIGTDAIVEDNKGAGASNGWFVNYLYGTNITLTYDIVSDREVEDVKISIRLSAELKDYFIQSKQEEGAPVYTIKLNGEAIDYGEIFFLGVPPQSSNQILPFEDYVLTVDAKLLEGNNTIELITDNNVLMGGTMIGTAPIVDCIKIETYANLNWTPIINK